MIYFLLVVALIGIDQITKYLAVIYLEPVGSMPFIPGIMELRFVLNDGAAFSFFAGKTWFLVGATSVALIALFAYILIKRPTSRLEMFSLILILSGGIGNLIDRIRNGVVVDFFATTFINFAVFNFADCFVVVGTFLLCAYIISDEIKISKMNKKQALNDNEAEKDADVVDEKEQMKESADERISLTENKEELNLQENNEGKSVADIDDDDE